MMDKYKVAPWFLLLMLVCWASGTYADEEMQAASDEGSSSSEKMFEPAKLKNSKNSLQNRIKFPKKYAKSDEDVSYLIRCDARISKTGKFLTNFCFDNSEEGWLFSRSITRASEGSTIQPGRVNGVVRNVQFQYYVVFSKKGSKTLVEVFPNSGLQVDTYGLDYTSAQRFRENQKGNFGSGCSSRKFKKVKAIIAKNGRPKSVAIEGEDLSEECVTRMKEDYMRQEYIPAFYKGEAVDSYYVEELFVNVR